MHRIHHTLASLLSLATSAFLAFSITAQVQETKANPTGTWTWTTPARGGGEPRKSTLKLKIEGDKLVGTFATPGRDADQVREIKIENAKIADDQISFTVTREFNQNKFTQKFTGKVSADTIKGKIEFERNGQTQSRDWEAKRVKDAK